MCNIAGYVGPKKAEPILLDMLECEEKWDACMSTGMAAVHEGKLTTERTLGPVAEFLKAHRPEAFPGNIGIAHSRSLGDYLWKAHPFTDRKETLAVVLNGTGRDVQVEARERFHEEISRELKAEGYFKPREVTDEAENDLPYPLTEMIAAYTAREIDRGACIAEAFANACSAFPGDFVSVMLHKDAPDRIYVCRITRPMVAALCEGESYIATTEFAFPADLKLVSVFSLPCLAVCEVTAGGVIVTPFHVKGTAVEGVSPCVYREAYDRTVTFLRSRAGEPCDFDTIESEFYRNWHDLWHEPMVDCYWKAPDGCLKPYAAVTYEILYELFRQGKLDITYGPVHGRTRFLVSLKPEFL